MNAWGGYRSDIVLALTGLDIEAKAELLEAAFWEAAPIAPDAFASVTTTVVRTDTTTLPPTRLPPLSGGSR